VNGFRKHSALLAAAVAAAALAIGACGGDDDDSGDSASEIGATEISTAPTEGILYEDVAGAMQRVFDESPALKGASFSCPPKENIRIGDTIDCELTRGAETGTLSVEVVPPVQDGLASLEMRGEIGGEQFAESASEVPPPPK
jgi:hypothetical protein